MFSCMMHFFCEWHLTFSKTILRISETSFTSWPLWESLEKNRAWRRDRSCIMLFYIHPELEGTCKDQWVQLLAPHRTVQKSVHMSESVIQSLPELWPVGCHDHCPGQPAQCLTVLLVKNLQPDPPLLQLLAVVLGSWDWLATSFLYAKTT